MFLRYIWLAVPFLLLWLAAPDLAHRMGAASMARLELAAVTVVAYLALRTAIAVVAPPEFRWEYVFPILDVVSVAALTWAAGRDPVSNFSVLYLLPIVEAAESLSVGWLFALSALIALSEAVATSARRAPGAFGTLYPYLFLFAFSGLSGLLARSAAQNRERLAVARDRERIALEMHDGVQGHLVSIASQLELLSYLVKTDAEGASRLARYAKDSARLAADELRYLVQRLRSPAHEGGFSAALQQFAFNLGQRTDIEIESIIEPIGEVRPELEHALFRIAQEALTNAIKHSKAEKIVLKLYSSSGFVVLEVCDDGQWRDPQFEGVGQGLNSMKARTEQHNGEFLNEHSEAGGTRIRVKAPV